MSSIRNVIVPIECHTASQTSLTHVQVAIEFYTIYAFRTRFFSALIWFVFFFVAKNLMKFLESISIFSIFDETLVTKFKRLNVVGWNWSRPLVAPESDTTMKLAEKKKISATFQEFMWTKFYMRMQCDRNFVSTRTWSMICFFHMFIVAPYSEFWQSKNVVMKRESECEKCEWVPLTNAICRECGV